MKATKALSPIPATELHDLLIAEVIAGRIERARAYAEAILRRREIDAAHNKSRSAWAAAT